RTHARDFKLNFRVVRDRHGSFARKIGATMTPEAFVVDATGRIRYHGRIDDQFVARRLRNANPSGTELRDAIAAVLEGDEVAARYVEAVGCPIPEPPAAVGHPTYTKDVALILQKNCLECHRRGQVGPFALETYEQARKRATDIATVVEDRLMPPWKASPHFGGKFQDARLLPEEGSSTLVTWADYGVTERSRAGGRGSPPTSRRRPCSPRNGRSAPPTWWWTWAWSPPSPPSAATSIDASSSPPGWRRTSMSRRPSIGRATAGWSTISWRMSIPPGKPGSATRPIRVRDTPASAVPASPSTAPSAAGPPASRRPPTAPADRCPGAATSSPTSITPPAASPRPIGPGSDFTSHASRSTRLCTGSRPSTRGWSSPPASRIPRSRRPGRSRSTSSAM